MLDETSALAKRAEAMAVRLERERKNYLVSGRINYYALRAMSIGSSVAGVAAAVLGLVPTKAIDKWEVGVVAAISPALVAASRQLGFQQKANWHYRKVDRIKTLQRRLAYEQKDDEIAAISRAWSAIDTDMSKEWEDMEQEPVAQTRRKNTSTPRKATGPDA